MVLVLVMEGVEKNYAYSNSIIPLPYLDCVQEMQSSIVHFSSWTTQLNKLNRRHYLNNRMCANAKN